MFAIDMKESRRTWVLLALVVLAVVIVFLSLAEDSIDVEQKREQAASQIVSVEKVIVAPATVKVTAFSEIKPRWSALLRASVSGRILEVQTGALAGGVVNANEPLITIEDSQYVAGLAAAKLTLQQAQLTLSKAEKYTAVARRQFKTSGVNPPNDLALHLPELRIAESTVSSAKARVAAAQEQLENTTIKAPFSGFVVERFVSPGQSVNVGDQLLKLIDNRKFDLVANVGRSDWALLQQPLAGRSATVLNQDGKPIAEAKIRNGGGFLDEKTRQYRIFLEITDSGRQTVLSGDFVRVLLPGIAVPRALNIPESALTREGYIWFVDEADCLQRWSPEVLFREQDRVIIRAPHRAVTVRVAITPLASFLPGQHVRPKSVE
jgi:RND family efflux transporter MFP subunit